MLQDVEKSGVTCLMQGVNVQITRHLHIYVHTYLSICVVLLEDSSLSDVFIILKTENTRA